MEFCNLGDQSFGTDSKHICLVKGDRRRYLLSCSLSFSNLKPVSMLTSVQSSLKSKIKETEEALHKTWHFALNSKTAFYKKLQ